MRLLSGFVAGMLLLGIGFAIWVLLLPDPHRPTIGEAKATAQPAPPQAATLPPEREVRVVYPDATTAGAMRAGGQQSVARVDPTVTPPVVSPPAPASVPPAASVQPNDPQTSAPATPTVDDGAAATLSTTVNLNTASVEALNQLTGGGAIGRTIVAHRPYRSVDDLLSKRVLRRSVFDRIKAQVAAE
jgi:DNA uptake protein ComE-like DNA-binding protein